MNKPKWQNKWLLFPDSTFKIYKPQEESWKKAKNIKRK